MANKCEVCSKFFNSTIDGVKCVKCAGSYHKHCVTMGSDPKKWVCTKCKGQNKKVSDQPKSQHTPKSHDSSQDDFGSGSKF